MGIRSDKRKGLPQASTGDQRNRTGRFYYRDKKQGNDPLLASVVSLHSVQDALQQEIRQLKEIGNGQSKLDVRGHALESQHELEHISSVLSTKETQLNDLKEALTKNMKGGEARRVLFLLEIELETLFKLRIEAEVEYLCVLSCALEQRRRVSLLGQQRQMVDILADAERKAFILRSKAEGLQASFDELLDAEEVLKLQNQVHQQSLWFLIQLLVLLLAFLLLQFFVRTPDVVPT